MFLSKRDERTLEFEVGLFFDGMGIKGVFQISFIVRPRAKEYNTPNIHLGFFSNAALA